LPVPVSPQMTTDNEEDATSFTCPQIRAMWALEPIILYKNELASDLAPPSVSCSLQSRGVSVSILSLPAF